MKMSTKDAASRCCVFGCKNNIRNYPGTKFYRFPKRSYLGEQRKKWIAAVKRQIIDGSPWEPGDSSRICSRHFIGNEKSGISLSPNYVPTIFSYSQKINPTIEDSMKIKTEETPIEPREKCLPNEFHEDIATTVTDQEEELYSPENYVSSNNVFVCEVYIRNSDDH